MGGKADSILSEDAVKDRRAEVRGLVAEAGSPGWRRLDATNGAAPVGKTAGPRSGGPAVWVIDRGAGSGHRYADDTVAVERAGHGTMRIDDDVVCPRRQRR